MTLQQIQYFITVCKYKNFTKAADKLYMSSSLDTTLSEAEKEAEKMNDTYISVEHIFIGIMSKANAQVKKLLDAFGIAKDEFLKILKEIRGNQTVNNENPEATYDVLKKYGQSANYFVHCFSLLKNK